MPDDSLQIDVTLDATTICGGLYESDLVLVSNDPDETVITIPVQMSVKGTDPNIAVSDTTFDFGPLFIGATAHDSLMVTNTGCDVLSITDVNSDHGDFIPSPTTFNLNPGEVQAVQIAFSPTTVSVIFGTLSVISNDPDQPVVTVDLQGEGLEAPVVVVSPDSLYSELWTGEMETQLLNIANNGGNDLEWEIDIIGRDPAAKALQTAARNSVDGITRSGLIEVDGRQYPAFTEVERDRFQQQLVGYQRAIATSNQTSDKGGGLPLIGVGGYHRSDLMYYVLANPELSSQFAFVEVDYTYGNLEDLDGLMIAGDDGEITSAGATALRAFYDSRRPIFLGMDDLNYNWSGDIPGLLGPVFGIDYPSEGELCGTGIVNPDHPINEGITFFTVGGWWCNDNDHFVLTDADWVFRQDGTGYNFGVANEGTARTVLMGEALSGIWDANEQLNVNAVIWMMGAGGLPSVDPEFGTVPAGGSTDVIVTFDATDLCGGDYLADLLINSNDPVTPVDSVATHLNVDGETDIAVSDTLLAYGQIFLGGSRSNTLVVSNPGCDLLTVTDITIDHGDFTTDTTPFDLAVGDARELVVTFAPTSVAVITGSLSITSNDPDEPLVVIDLEGEGLEAPVIGVAPDSLYSELWTGEMETQILTIANGGGNDLEWSIDIEQPDKSTRALYTLTTPVPGVPDDLDEKGLAGAELTGKARADGGGTGKPRQKALTTRLGNLTDVQILWDRSHYQSPSSGWFIIVDDLIARGATITENFDPITPELLADYHILWTVDCESNWLPAELAAIADWVNHGGSLLLEGDNTDTVAAFNLILAACGAGIEYSADNGTDGDTTNIYPHETTLDVFTIRLSANVAHLMTITSPAAHLVDDPVGVPNSAYSEVGFGRIVAMADEVFGSGHIAYADNQLFANQVFDWLALGISWLRADPAAGSVAPGGSVDVQITFDATDLCGGDYLANLNIDNNDPLSPLFVVPTHLNVTGETDIAVSDTLLAYGQVFIGGSRSDTLVVANVGCDLLSVTDITIDHADYVTDTTPFDLAVGDIRELVVTFTPGSVAVITGSLSITCNDPDQPVVVIDLEGEGVESPVISVSPDSMYSELWTGEIETQILTIANSGGSDLDWYIAVIGRDDGAKTLQAAARDAVAGITRSGFIEVDGERHPDFTAEERARFQRQLARYQKAVASATKADLLPLIGVGGVNGNALLYYLLANPELTSQFIFVEVDYAYGNLTDLDGLIISGDDGEITEDGASALRDFYDSRRPIFLGMDDLNYNWSGNIPGLLQPVFGIDHPVDDSFCNPGTLNPDHPINEGVTVFNVSGWWCNDNDHFVLTDADWVFREDGTGYNFGVANEGTARTVLMGESLYGIWTGNEQLNVNAVLWMMEATGLPGVDPEFGTVPAGGSTDVTVTFDATDICGGDHLADLLICSNDPVTPVDSVATHLHVNGTPDIAVSDTMLAYGQVILGSSRSDTLVVANDGCDILSVTDIAITHPDFTTDTTPFDLDIGESRALEVTYTPGGIGSHTGNLILTSNDPDEPQVFVDLTGMGVEAPDIAVAPDSLSCTIWEGGIQTQVLTISNSGGSGLNWSIDVQELMARLTAAGPKAPSAGASTKGEPGKSAGKIRAGGESRTTQALAPAGEKLAVLSPKSSGELAVTSQGEIVSWLSIHPASGTVAAGGNVDVIVIFNAGSLSGGFYDATITVYSNDPDEPAVPVPTSLHVQGSLFMVEIDVSRSGSVDEDNMLGASDSATDGYDAGLDVPEPPTTPGYISGYFPHPEWGIPAGERFQTDLRASYDPLLQYKTWTFVVETDQGNTMPIFLRFFPDFDETSGWSFYLLDTTTGLVLNLYPTLTYSFSLAAPGSRTFEITVGMGLPPLSPPTRTLTDGWSLIGCPLEPLPGSQTLGHVIYDDACGPIFLFSYGGESGYGERGPDDPVVQGEGLWIANSAQFIWSMEGTPDADGVLLPLRNGWTLVGYPLWMPGDLSSVLVDHDSQRYTYADAVAAGLVAAYCYGYDPGTGSYSTTTSQDTWHGYWFAAFADGVELWYDYQNLPVKRDGMDDPFAEMDSENWLVSVGLVEGTDSIEFGMSESATDGFDAAFDLPIPPDAPTGSSAPNLQLPHPEWELGTGDFFRSDIIAATDEPRLWSATVHSPEPGTVTLQWDSAIWPDDLDLQIYLPGQNRVVVGSMREQATVALAVGVEPLPVQFRTPEFLTDTPDAVLAGLNLRNVPNPFNPSTDFLFNLSQSSRVEIRIYDVRGAMVRSLEGGVMPAGPARLCWRGRDNSGAEVASGAYFYRLYLDGRHEGPARKMIMLK